MRSEDHSLSVISCYGQVLSPLQVGKRVAKSHFSILVFPLKPEAIPRRAGRMWGLEGAEGPQGTASHYPGG